MSGFRVPEILLGALLGIAAIVILDTLFSESGKYCSTSYQPQAHPPALLNQPPNSGVRSGTEGSADEGKGEVDAGEHGANPASIRACIWNRILGFLDKHE